MQISNILFRAALLYGGFYWIEIFIEKLSIYLIRRLSIKTMSKNIYPARHCPERQNLNQGVNQGPVYLNSTLIKMTTIISSTLTHNICLASFLDWVKDSDRVNSLGIRYFLQIFALNTDNIWPVSAISFQAAILVIHANRHLCHSVSIA